MLVRLGLAISLLVAGPTAVARAGEESALPARTALDDYLETEDDTYRWKELATLPGEGYSVHLLELRSQTWLDEERVDRPVWTHWLTIVRPHRPTTDAALLFIGGGSNGREPPRGPDRRMAALAQATGSVTCELRMIPNQPLVFLDDPEREKRWEDDLIAYAWTKYIETGDTEWLPRFPMVKSAVRAMDAVAEFLGSEKGGGRAVERFVVAGGSKRGWTTWLTGLDDRVIAIIPIVIDVLNTVRSMDHHFAAYGFWAPAIGDYVRHGLIERRDDPRYRELLSIVDPYNYRHRLEIPKLLINATGDQFFLPDSSRFYFDDLRGEKHLRYVPNADHSLDGTDAVETIAGFFLSVASGTPRPKYSWSFEDDGSIRVESETAPKAVRVWHATNPKARDFRVEELGRVWESRELEPGDDGAWKADVPAPEEGFTAFLVELEFEAPGETPLRLTTAVRVVPDVLPHAEKLRELIERLREKSAKREGASKAAGDS